MVAKHNVTFEQVLLEIKKYIKKEENLNLILQAYEFASIHHDGQYRKSGDPYIIHLIQVAYILAQLRTGPITITAGLLHDVIEDCNVSKEEVCKKFGTEVAMLVESVTKIGNLKFKDEKEYLASNHRKIFIAMAKDVRVILIKLADRLHNMRTLQFMRLEKQKKIASETLEVYAPIAHRLGISEIKNELEDLSFLYLNTEKYHEIASLVEKKKVERDSDVKKMIFEISSLLDNHNIKYRIFGRSKHLYSIYKKMYTKQKRFEEILDLLAIRIITTDDTNCYEILGYIHAKYRPIPGRFKDYIAMPKVNMYQSLHTTIVGNEGNIFEIQIRTEHMDRVAEQGIAAHWVYKENIGYNKKLHQKEIEEQLHWFRDFSIMSDENTDNPINFMKMMQQDIFEANVYVMSPKGRVIVLPNGATPIDFAYRIHTEIGHKTVGAVVNGALVPLNTNLKTGDVVDIRTSNQSDGPSEDWIKVVKSSHAKNKIKAFFQKKELEQKSHYIKKGEEILYEEIKKRKISTSYMDKKKIESILSSLSFTNYNDLMYALGIKNITLNAVIDRLIKQRHNMDNDEVVELLNRQEFLKRKTLSDSGVIVPGVDTMKVSLASCCLPIPNEKIIGYITKGSGVKVHRIDCPNIIHQKDRLIDVYWEENIEQRNYEVKLILKSLDRNFLLSDIITMISQSKAGLNHIDSKVEEDKVHVTTKITIVIKGYAHLETVLANLKKITSVISIERVIM